MLESEVNPRIWLVELRGEKTQKEMADQLGISRAYYSQLELGIRGASVDTARKLAPCLGVPWTRFFEDGQAARSSCQPNTKAPALSEVNPEKSRAESWSRAA